MAIARPNTYIDPWEIEAKQRELAQKRAVIKEEEHERARAEARKGPPKCYDCRWYRNAERFDDKECHHPRNEDLVVPGLYRMQPGSLRHIDDDSMRACGFAGHWFEEKEDKGND